MGQTGCIGAGTGVGLRCPACKILTCLADIDFGHFLGNIMKFAGFKRETAPFVLTPEFAHVMGGVKSDMFQWFVELCCTAFNALRKHGHMLINLFSLVRPHLCLFCLTTNISCRCCQLECQSSRSGRTFTICEMH